MTTIQWRNFRSNDTAAPLSIEETFKRYASLSGIHDYTFDTLYAGDLTVTHADDGSYVLNLVASHLPANLTVRYHKTAAVQGCVIQGGAGALYFAILTSESDVQIHRTLGTSQQTLPKVVPDEADIEIVLRQQTFDDISGIVWRSVTLYANGVWITTYSDYLTAAYGDLQVGFLTSGADVDTAYTNIVIPELGDTAEFGTTDPGEYPLSGLQRTMEGRYLKYYVRWNGELRAWKQKQRVNVLTLAASGGRRRTFDLPSLITHARMMGAYIWSEAVDRDTLILYGHRFQEVNNSMLLTQPECAEEAVNTLKRSQETAFGMLTQDRHVPILEPEDRITIDGEDWVINDYSFEISPARITQVYTCRKYVWG